MLSLLSQDPDDLPRKRPKLSRQILGGVRLPELVNPKSAYHGHESPLPVTEEKSVLEDILAEDKLLHDDHTADDESSFIEVDLEDVSIYLPYRPVNSVIRGAQEKALSYELTPLNKLYQNGENFRLMDGILCYSGKRRYVQRVPFETISIGRYEDQKLDTVGSEIWIQSLQGKKSGIWYRVRSPAPEYRRYHEPFLWIADLAKHVIDYLHGHQKVTIFDFRSRFLNWLNVIHESSDVFRRWLSTYKDTDFRRVVASHSGFLYHQATQLDFKYAQHPLWSEIDAEALNALPNQCPQSGRSNAASAIHKTVVTPYVLRCFGHMPFARFLKSKVPAPGVLRLWNEKLLTDGFSTDIAGASMATQQTDEHKQSFGDPVQVCVGDVVAIRPDEKSSWKHNDRLWYGYVQGTQEMRKGTSLDIIWLYRPADTACQGMRYPYANELFLSDHCNCDDHQIYTTDVVSRPTVSYFTGPNEGAEFFIRQKYIGDDAVWVTLHESDFRCTCKSENTPHRYCTGDTLLVKFASAASEYVLEAVEAVEVDFEGDETRLRVRRLLWRARDQGVKDADPNELVYSNSFKVISTEEVVRPCHIRFFTIEDKLHNRIPVQYRRGGVGDFYYILQNHPRPLSMKQGWDSTEKIQTNPSVMQGLDIFCGGGNLGRGLEEGGAVKFQYAVDYFREAIHTYRANLQDPDDAKLFYGSVNDYLSQAMSGDTSMANLGGVDVISAGSPCQGFSNANQRKENDLALLNISMVASVVSFVDFYRPKYALLENVTAMAKCGTKGGEDNAFAQVLSALVGMGYQTRSFILDAWSFGSPQSRTRLFISITAPGLVPLENPPRSHSHPETTGARSLGKSANGLTFANRSWDHTPFSYVTIGEATKDLPLNYDGRIDCIAFPDHRPSRPLTTFNRVRISCIPRFPPGMNYVKAALCGQMPPPQMVPFNKKAQKKVLVNGRAWKRVLQDALLSTVTTTCQPEDDFCGAWVHWDACRCMTVMEVRRAQGFPDEEVILGLPSYQWKIIGNSVARPVAFALGMALRAAWLANEKKLSCAPLSETAGIHKLNTVRPNGIYPCFKSRSKSPTGVFIDLDQ